MEIGWVERLDDRWRAAPADDDLRRTALDPGYDDSPWEPIAVPGHWRTHATFAASDGPLLYRRPFSMAGTAIGDEQRLWVTVEGVCYQADVWLDGAYLGDPEGLLSPSAFDITALARLADDHVLALEVACPPQRPGQRRTLTGALQASDVLPTGWNPGGIWRPVHLEVTGPVRIDRLRVLCRDVVVDSRAHLRIHARLDADAGRTVEVRTSVDGVLADVRTVGLAAGSNEIDWTLDIKDPQLWWPWSLGEQHLTHVAVEVVTDGVVSHRVDRRTGLREVSLQDWTCTVNHERLFLKGTAFPPTAADLAGASPAGIRRDVELAREAGLDLIRVRAHVAHPALYDAADELGMLVWQDVPMQGRMARSVRGSAVRQARDLVDALGHHPSIAVWCGHDDPNGDSATPSPAWSRRQQLPSWNRTVLDSWVKRALETADETRPVIAHSGVAPHLPQLDGTDSHLFFGWRHGAAADLAGFAAGVPRMVRFVGAFGARSVPDRADFLHPERWPDLEDDAVDYGYEVEPFDHHVPPTSFGSFRDWQQATQRHQADVLRRQIEILRRLKYRPTGGFCFLQWYDPEPTVGFGVLDHDRAPKLAHQAVVDACRPVIVVADPLPELVRPGDALALDIHVVSDRHDVLAATRCTAALRWAGGHHAWSWMGDLPADECVRIGTIQFVVPDALGALWLDLSIEHGSEVASNRYEARIGRA
jgi:beta-mannosidase